MMREKNLKRKYHFNKMKLTQRELIMTYINNIGSIVPARVIGIEYQGNFFGSEVPRRCRELRKEGILASRPWAKDSKFEEFYGENNNRNNS